jgi:hypothetical protein
MKVLIVLTSHSELGNTGKKRQIVDYRAKSGVI